MPSLWAHVARGAAYSWIDEDFISKRRPLVQNTRILQNTRTRSWELDVVRHSLFFVAVPSYLFWLRFVLLGSEHNRAAAFLTLLLVLFPVWFWNPRGISANLIVVLWVVVVVIALDTATNFETAVCAILHVVPALSAVLGGGRLVVLGTLATLLALLLLTGVAETVGHTGPGPTSIALFVSALLEFIAAAATTWLFERLLCRIRHLQKESEEWSRMLSRDIRTPLHGLVGLLDDLREQNLVTRDAKSRKIIVGCTRMLQVVCDNMLGPPTEVVRPNSTSLRMSGLVDEVADLARAMAKLRSQRVTVTLAPTTSANAFVRVRFHDFLQILGNIVSNSVKFSPVRSSIDIYLSVEAEEDGFVLQFIVEDSGPGIPPHMRERLFQPFERGNAPSEVVGLGLGLSIVAQIAAATGGSVEIHQGKKLGGARFVLRMPCTVALVASSLLYDLSASNFKLGRVLIVDDNALNRRILLRFVGMLGIARDQITDAPSGESALNVVERADSPYGVAFLDMVLPGMLGIELAQRLSVLHAQKFPHDPAIVLIGASASLTPAVSRSWARVGVIKQLSKPFTKEIVGEAFEFVYEQRRSPNRAQEAGAADEPGWFSGTKFQSDTTMEFTAPLGPPNPVNAAQLELRSQLSKFDIAVWLRILVSFAFSDSDGSSRLMELYSLWVMSYRWILNKHPKELRIALVLSVYFALVIKSSLSGCGVLVGYSLLPLFAAFFTELSLYLCLAICGIGQIGMILLKTWHFLPVRMYFDNFVFHAETLHDTATMTVLMTMFILIDLSLVALAASTRQRWSSTISHDVRGPLHGILAACRDLEENDSLAPQFRQTLHEISAIATCLLGVADAVLGFAVERVSMVDTVRLDELQLTLRDLATMALEPDYVEMAGEVTIGAHILCDEPLMMYALTQFIAAPSLMVLERVRIRVSMSLNTIGDGPDSVLTISAEEAARPPSLDAVVHEYVDNASVVWGGSAKRSALARIVEDFLGGSLIFIRDAPARIASGAPILPNSSRQTPWKLSIVMPVIAADDGQFPNTTGTWKRSNTAEPTLEETERKISKLRVAVVDDARLNLRVFRRLLNKCGVHDIVEFWSSRVAVSALGSGDFDGVDVVFLDLRMPTVDGFQLASNIIAQFRAMNCPASTPTLVACSSDASVATALKCTEAGIGIRLPKPFAGDALKRVLVKVAAGRSDLAERNLL